MSTVDTTVAHDAAFDGEPANSQSMHIGVYEGTTDIKLTNTGRMWVRYEDYRSDARAEVYIHHRATDTQTWVLPPLAYYSVSENDSLVYKLGPGRQQFRIGWGFDDVAGDTA
jgi:hypothetical protein